MTPSRTLVLFNYDWDSSAFERLAPLWPTDSAGFDLFSFPSNVRLAFFDLQRFVEGLARQVRRRGWGAVVSHHEQFGALGAALLAERLGWPGTPVAAVLACQNKLLTREVLQRVCPQANVAFAPLAAGYGEPIPEGLHYPSFIKPVKAAFSVLARKVANHGELTALTRFKPLEQWIIRRLVEPFDRIARERLPDAPSAHGMVVESWVEGTQHNLDGYVFNGEVRGLGVVDAMMYPGTQAFQRFEHRTVLSLAVQRQALEVATAFLKAIGFSHGFFNMEFFHDEASGALKVIEFNPRLASQLADLYRRVDGIDAHAGSLALAAGRDPARAMRCEPNAGAAASFVFRAFDPTRVPAVPSAQRQREFARVFPDGWLQPMPKQGVALARDFKWLGSHRYGVMHLGGCDRHDLHERFLVACALLGWPHTETRDLHPRPAASGHRALPQVSGVVT